VAPEANETQYFPGFPDFRANVTFVPIQFFTVVVPHCSRGTVRIVGYALRKVLGWVDEHGNPTREQLRFNYRELIEKAGVSRECVADALRQALDRHFLRCVHAPRPHREGEQAQSGVYEICWDVEGAYTNQPSEFRGFYYPESAIIQDQGGAGLRSKAARKNIPNAFFDYLLPRERLSVIRVVAALLFYSIQWGPGGERRVSVSRSISELSRLTRMSRSRVHEAVVEAQRRGYIELAQPGRFDLAGGENSLAAIYRVRWVRPSATVEGEPAGASGGETVRNGERETERSEKVNGQSVRKGERDQSEKANGQRSQNVNGISIKTRLKKEETAAPERAPTTADSKPVVAVESGFESLRKAGFDVATARRLALERSEDVIRRQIAWLPRRTVNRNRLGLLRRAIEEDWPKPHGVDPAEEDSPLYSAAKLFASHYYAAYHGFAGEAATEPFPKDLEVAAQFLSRLLKQDDNHGKVPEWGRRFGRLTKEAHRTDPKAKPNLSFALVLFGDRFLQEIRTEGSARRTEAHGKARKAHQAAFAAAYLQFLRETENRLREAKPAVYETFVRQREKLRRVMTSGPILVSAERIAAFDAEQSRLLAFVEFFHDNRQVHVPDFWEWERHHNPNAFGVQTSSSPSQEAHS
jgi:hypothetical protein